MSTPERKGKKTVGSSTPKLARGTQPVGSSFDSSALHQSGSKAVQSRVVGLNEQIVKRKTELAELLRSAGKKRFKKNEPGEDVSLGDLQQGFPEMDSDPEAAENNDQADDQAMFAGLKGSLLNDSNSFMQSPVTGEADSVVFSPVTGGFTDANNYFANGEEFITGTAHELHMEQEQLEEVEDALDDQLRAEEEEEDGVAGPVVGQYAATAATASGAVEEEPLLDQSRISAFDTVLEYVGDGPMSSETPRWPSSGGVDGGSADGFEGNRVAKTLVFPDMQKPVGAPKAISAAATKLSAAVQNQQHQHQHDASTFTPIVTRPASFLGAPFAAPASSIQTAFLTGADNEQQAARRTSPLAGNGSSSGEHKSSGHPFVPPTNTYNSHSQAKTPAATTSTTSTSTHTNTHTQEEMDLSMSALYPENHSLVNFSSSGPVYMTSHTYSSTHVNNSSFSSSSSTSAAALGYRDSLLHQLKVTTAKNEMLQGKLRDIEELVDRNYGSISERSKLLTAERNKLERQRTLLDDELVATKEELLFIRAQLQNKSARITELENELLEAQRMLVEPGSDSEDGTDGATDGQRSDFVSPEKAFGAGADRSMLSPEASASSMHLARSPAEVAAAEEESAREIELLGGLLVEQEQQLIEAEQNRLKVAELQEKYQTTLDENFQLASFVETAEKKSEEMAGRVTELEEQVRLAEELAFEFEARAAALELEMFKKMDEDHHQAIQMARDAEKAQSSALPPSSNAPKMQQKGGDVNTLVYNSSPSLPLLLRPSAPPRVPREGYAALLIVIALLQAVIWGLVLLGGLLYLGMLELRFGIDIVRDGGVYEQLFLLKGVSAIADTVTQSVGLDLASIASVDLSLQGLQHLAGAAQEVVQEAVTGAAASAGELFEQGLQFIR